MSCNTAERLEALREETIRELEPTLSDDQTKVVFGAGNPDARMMLVGEAPGPQEDKEGIPFVGTSGEALTDVLAGLGLDREDLWISNVVKVWPNRRNGNSVRTRPPYAAERRASWPFFEREVELVAPDVMVLLGGTAAKQILDRDFKVTQQRGEWYEGLHGIPTIATYHPAYILRMGGFNSSRGAELAEEFTSDLKKAATRAGILPSSQNSALDSDG